MRKSDSRPIRVKNPSLGLMTYVPPDLSDADVARHIVAAQNVRAEFGSLRTAPGYERVHVETNLDSPANLIFQSNIVANQAEVRSTPLVGTSGRLYVVRRQARELVCNSHTTKCGVTFVALSDTGSANLSSESPALHVAEMVRRLSPDFVISAGDHVTASAAPHYPDPYELYFSRLYWRLVGGYSGVYGIGPEENKWFGAMGDRDWIDGPGDRYLTFFRYPPPRRYYSIRRGPVEVFVLNSYGHGPMSVGPGGVAIAGTGATEGVGEADLSWPNSEQAQWLQQAVAESDTTWRIVVFHHPAHTSAIPYSPGFAVMDWPWHELGIDLVINGHARHYERLQKDGVTRLVLGTGGAEPLDNFLSSGDIITDLDQLILTELGDHLIADLGTDEAGSPYSEFKYKGHGVLRVEANWASLRAEFISLDSSVIDEFQLESKRPSAVCYIADVAKKPLALEVVPSEVSVDAGDVIQLTATLYYKDGSSEDVTETAAWTSSDSTIATVERGLVVGIRSGEIDVTASHSGLSDDADITVRVACVDEPVDMVVCVDYSESMLTGVDGNTRLGLVHQGLGVLINLIGQQIARGLDKLRDRIGLVYFAGDYASQTPFSILAAHLGSSIPELLDAQRFYARGPQYEHRGDGSSIQDAVGVAMREFHSDRHIEGNRKVLVIVTDGPADISEPRTIASDATMIENGMNRALTAVQAAQAEGVVVAVIGIGLESSPWRDVVRGLSTNGDFYYDAKGADDFLTIFPNLMADVCRRTVEPDPDPDPDPPPEIVVDPENLDTFPVIDVPPGSELHWLMSGYVWAVTPPANPLEELSAEQIACHGRMAAIEFAQQMDDLTALGYSVTPAGPMRFVWVWGSGWFYMAIRKVGICDPNNPEGDVPSYYSNGYTGLFLPVIVTPNPEED